MTDGSPYILVQSTQKRVWGQDPGNLLVIRYHPNTTGMPVTWITWVSSWVFEHILGLHWRMDNLAFSSKLLQIVHNVYQRHHLSMASLHWLWVARLWKFRFLKDSSKTGTNGLFLLGLVLIPRMKHQRVVSNQWYIIITMPSYARMFQLQEDQSLRRPDCYINGFSKVLPK